MIPIFFAYIAVFPHFRQLRCLSFLLYALILILKCLTTESIYSERNVQSQVRNAQNAVSNAGQRVYHET